MSSFLSSPSSFPPPSHHWIIIIFVVTIAISTSWSSNRSCAPESVRWLVARGEKAEARRLIQRAADRNKVRSWTWWRGWWSCWWGSWPWWWSWWSWQLIGMRSFKCAFWKDGWVCGSTKNAQWQFFFSLLQLPLSGVNLTGADNICPNCKLYLSSTRWWSHQGWLRKWRRR